MSDKQMVFLKDYQETDYTIDKVDLCFELKDSITQVKARLTCQRLSPDSKAPLILNGENLRLLEVSLDDTVLLDNQYQVNSKHLTLSSLPKKFTLETVVEIAPINNLALSGLYMSSGNYCTQCEPEGFRRITYFLDRPDVMSVYTCTIFADESKAPVLLSNGNLIASGKAKGGRHWVKWHDPSKKPCYLFALVAGVFDCVSDDFITMSGKKVQLDVFVTKGKSAQANFALAALQKAMLWDEKVYLREYDLDRYMIVSVGDFNFGAMENKGLNIFNDRYVLAKTETATDADFLGVEIVIGHEYFHNWTGNRITLNNWFQLCLKEGLTVFREHGFAAFVSCAGVRRINEAKLISIAQFAEESGPMAHPVRPDKFCEINNFYTITVYNKGAELVRMLSVWLGDKLFSQGMQNYFAKFDGQAIAVENFLSAMQQSSKVNLKQFSLWYTECGVVCLQCSVVYNKDKKVLTIKLKQSLLNSDNEYLPRVIPVQVAFLNNSGESVFAKDCQGESCSEPLLLLTKLEQEFVFDQVANKPLVSVLRGFSAPVQLDFALSYNDSLQLIKADSDSYVRWRTLSVLYVEHIKKCLANKKVALFDDKLLSVYRSVLQCSKTNPAEIVEILTLPEDKYILSKMPGADVCAIYEVKKQLNKMLAQKLYDVFLSTYKASRPKVPYSYDVCDVSLRVIRNFCLKNLVCSAKEAALDLCSKQLNNADNMTDMMGAIHAVINSDNHILRKKILDDFYLQWQKESLVVDKWFSCQAASCSSDALKLVQNLCEHEAFNWHNPNRVRALIGVFAESNIAAFHDVSGAGYAFLADAIIKIDKFNAQLAARLCNPLVNWRKFDETRQSLMLKELNKISDKEGLSKDVKEVISKAVL